MKRNILLLFAIMLVVIPMAMAGSISRSITASGTSVSVTLTVNPSSETFYYIDETYPTGATVVTNGGGDATTRPPHIFWAVTSNVAATSYTYTLSVPSSWTTASFSGQYIFENGATSNIGGSGTVSLGGSSCTPSCSGKTCGSDGCGSTCGSCNTGYTCGSSNQCISTNTCTGPATCSVGSCAGTYACNSGVLSTTCVKTDSVCGTSGGSTFDLMAWFQESSLIAGVQNWLLCVGVVLLLLLFKVL